MVVESGAQVSEPLNQLNEMLVDEDLIEVGSPCSSVVDNARSQASDKSDLFRLACCLALQVRAELRELRDSLKTTKNKDKGMFSMLTNPIKEAAETIGVEWKD